MAAIEKPKVRTANPNFSSGPCAKRPGWTPAALAGVPAGRSHRAPVGKVKLKASIDLTREILGVPADYRNGIVPASDKGAFEMDRLLLPCARCVFIVSRHRVLGTRAHSSLQHTCSSQIDVIYTNTSHFIRPRTQ